MRLFSETEIDMRYEQQRIIDKLESLQYDILFWKREEKSEKNINRLADYDSCIDELIDMVSDLD